MPVIMGGGDNVYEMLPCDHRRGEKCVILTRDWADASLLGTHMTQIAADKDLYMEYHKWRWQKQNQNLLRLDAYSFASWPCRVCENIVGATPMHLQNYVDIAKSVTKEAVCSRWHDNSYVDANKVPDSLCNVKQQDDTTDVHMVIAVFTRRSAKERREAIRATWAKGHGNVFFIVAEQPCQTKENDWWCRTEDKMDEKHLLMERVYATQLQKEVQEHNDIVFVNMREQYRNLPRKLKLMLGWALMKFPHAQWFFKVDDDCFVRPKSWDTHLRQLTFNDPAVIGNIEYGGGVHRSGKWKETIYKPDIYPPFPNNVGGYIINRPVAEYFWNSKDSLVDYQGDDVAVGIWLDESPLKARVRWTQSPHVTGNKHLCKHDNIWLAAHDISIQEMYACAT